MKYIIASILLWLVILPACVVKICAAEIPSPIVISLWTDKHPQYSNNLSPESEKEESPNWISNVTTPELYVYPAANPSGLAMLMCPGGGYAGVAIMHEGHELASFFNEAGITLAVLKYRMPNGNKNVPLEDVYEALRILNDRAGQWGIDPLKIGIGGASAGGHLASTAATHPCADQPPLYFQLLLYPVITMEDGITHAGSKENLLGGNPTAEDIKNFSNEKQVSDTTPPAFIAVSADDEGVPVENSIRYFQELNSKKTGSSLHIYPSGGHGWGARRNFPYADLWRQELRCWLENLH